jgi:hypothetical protein
MARAAGDPATDLTDPTMDLTGLTMDLTDPTTAPATDDSAAPPAGRALVRGAARSLLVTPWFAASMGVVVAAGLWIYAPHTVLRFPNSTPLTEPCAGSGCTTGNGQPAVSSPGQKIPDPPPAGRHARARESKQPDAVHGIAFTYKLAQQGSKFSEVITLSGLHLPANWALTFEIVNTHIRHVVGVHWQLWTSRNGGKATPDRSSQSGPRASRDTVTFLVLGSGQATSPVSCFFDSRSCSFSPASVGGPAAPPPHRGHHHRHEDGPHPPGPAGIPG